MSREVIRFKNGAEQPVDDHKIKANGQSAFILAIIPHSHERVLYNADQVFSIRQETQGFQGGELLGKDE